MKSAASDRLPAVVLIGGWGLPVTWLQPLVPNEAAVTAWSLSDLAAARGDCPEAWVDQALSAAPDGALWMGWSLGGQLAMLAAERAPERVAGVVTLCATPRFVSGADWPQGRPESDFAAFAGQVRQDPQAALRRFVLMQTRGDADASLARQWLRDLPVPSSDVLNTTLDWLRDGDWRRLWQRYQHVLHILGERDPLVSPSSADEAAPGSTVTIVPGMAHCPLGRGAKQVREQIKNHWQTITIKPTEVAP